MTDDLISRADAMAYPLSWEHYDKEHGSRKFISGVESYREYIEHLPSAQPKIVRCKECKKANTEDCSHSYWDDDWGVWRIGYKGDDWFCADGEREGE